MNIQLTNEFISETFAKTGVDAKYFPIYEAEIKRRYEDFQKENPENEEKYEDDYYDYIYDYLSPVDDYIQYYITEIEKGHSHKWAHSYALEKVTDEHEYTCIKNACNNFESEKELEKELFIHINSINNDPLFIKRYRQLIDDDGFMNEDLCKLAKDYCRQYLFCIDKGKSENYAQAYADSYNRGFSIESCKIQAQAYDLAKMHGMDNDEALGFADKCGEAWGGGLVHEIKSFFELYPKKWQKDFYISLMRRDYSEFEINEILKWS